MNTPVPEPTQSPSNPAPSRAEGVERAAFRRLFAFLNIVHLVILGIVLNSLLFGDIQVWLSFRLTVLATLIFAIATERGWLVLLALLGMLLARETPTRSMVPELRHAVFAFASLLLVAYAYLAPQIKTRISSPIANLFLGTPQDKDGRQTEPANMQNRAFKRFLLVFVPALLLAAMCLGSMFILSLSPTTYQARSELFRTVGRQDWMLATASSIMVFLLGTYLVLREFNFRPSTRAAASLYLRSQLSLDFSKELRVLFNRWTKRQKALRNANNKSLNNPKS